MIRTLAVNLAAMILVSTVGCGPPQRTVRVAANQASDLSDRWNDTDARLTAEALIPVLLNGGWLTTFRDAQGRQPALRVRTIVNKTDEHIDAQVFIKSIEKALVNSGYVTVLAQAGAELGSVHAEQAYGLGENVAVESAAGIGQETGADFVVTVRMTSVLDQRAGQRVKLYKIDVELTDATSGGKAWMGDHEIKKVTEQAAAAF